MRQQSRIRKSDLPGPHLANRFYIRNSCHSRYSWLCLFPRGCVRVLGIVIVLYLTGCGGGDTVRVTGKLIKDGKPYTAKLDGKEPETFAVDFVGKVNGAQFIFPATLAADGTFRVADADGRGIPRGQYRIHVLHSGFLGAGGDRFQARFAGDKTPLSVELTENASLTIDVGAGTVSK